MLTLAVCEHRDKKELTRTCQNVPEATAARTSLLPKNDWVGRRVTLAFNKVVVHHNMLEGRWWRPMQQRKECKDAIIKKRVDWGVDEMLQHCT